MRRTPSPISLHYTNLMGRRGFEIRGEPATLLTLYLYDDDLDRLRRFLKQKVAEAPAFFQDAPLVIDSSALPHGSWPMRTLLQICRERGLIPIAWRGHDPEQKVKARSLGLAVLSLGESRPVPPEEPVRLPSSTPLLIERPVRSGQRVYSRGDLIVIAPVNPGGEVIAEGNIHIYGTLRGRAIAGVQGDEACRIFCRQLDAELVAIAGHYLLHEDFPEEHLGRSVQIVLREDHLQFEPI